MADAHAVPLTPDTDVLIVGAGPTGLTVALSLLARGHPVTIVDDHAVGAHTSRAAVVYPGTLEVLDPYGVAERLVAQGIRTSRFTIRDRDRVLMPVPFDTLPTHFPYALLVSQAVTEAVLLERVQALGGTVRRPCTVTGLEQDDAGVTVTFAGGEQISAAFVVGADGAHSTVRAQARIGFHGDAAGASYTLADVRLTGGVPDDELVVYFSPAGHLVVLPLPGGIHRVVAHVAEAPEGPDVSFLQQVLDTRGPETERAVVHAVIWGARFLTRHLLADRYHAGRIVLAGDAAHVHSPLGGQGMNLGIHDAVALGRTLAGMRVDGSPDVLDAYSAAQRRVAKHVITVTDWLTKAATVHGVVRQVRNRVVGALNPIVRQRVAWQLSQLANHSSVTHARTISPSPGHDSPRSKQSKL